MDRCVSLVLRTGALLCALTVPVLAACVQQAPPDLVQSVEDLDQQLAAAHGAEFAPDDYRQFVQRWVALKERLRSDDDVISWPWEDNPFETDLRALYEEGSRVLMVATDRQHAERRGAVSNVARLERRLRRFTSRVDQIGSRVTLGGQRVETELLVKQARSFLEQGHFAHSVRVAQQADQRMTSQAAQLSSELSRYADKEQVTRWRAMVRRTVDWSKRHQAAAVVVVKAEQRLTLYKNGRAVVSYRPVRLGFNGVQEKRYEDDGATPEGDYRIIRKRDRGQTEFYRALLLDYPNADDQRRFQSARKAGAIPAEARIGGNIEIHGEANRQLSQTLGCVMLSNRQMNALFREVEVGTPVTIVGAVDVDNQVAVVLAQLDQGDDDPDDGSADSQDAPAPPDETAVERG
ncbi:MAG: L,D-transpeptidase family protein [Nitrospiraceae bacterium]